MIIMKEELETCGMDFEKINTYTNGDYNTEKWKPNRCEPWTPIP
jgi:hypothetical protein